MSGTGKKTQDLCTRSTFNNCCSFCCLFVSLFSFFKSLKIALLENFSRFFWHLPADKQTRDFCLARSNVCAFIYLVELSVHCVLLFVGFWLACMVWAVSSPVALAGFFFFFVLFFFFFNFLKQKIYFLLEVNLDLFLVSKHENHFNPPPPLWEFGKTFLTGRKMSLNNCPQKVCGPTWMSPASMFNIQFSFKW